MPRIGLVIPEVTCEILEFWENKHKFAKQNQCPRSKC